MVLLEFIYDLIDEGEGVPRYILQIPANIIRNQQNWQELEDLLAFISRDAIKQRFLKCNF